MRGPVAARAAVLAAVVAIDGDIRKMARASGACRRLMSIPGVGRDALTAADVVAIARTVLFRRVRSVLIRAHGGGLIAHTLNFDYEVRSAKEAFTEVPDAKADDEMLELALHIIKKKAGRFDPTTFDDRYDAALVELVKAKMEGRKILPPKAPQPTKPSDLMEALRKSASEPRAKKRKAAPRKTSSSKRTRRRKAA
jgi:DNA end-binding protein Ku